MIFRSLHKSNIYGWRVVRILFPFVSAYAPHFHVTCVCQSQKKKVCFEARRIKYAVIGGEGSMWAGHS